MNICKNCGLEDDLDYQPLQTHESCCLGCGFVLQGNKLVADIAYRGKWCFGNPEKNKHLYAKKTEQVLSQFGNKLGLP